MNWIAAWTPHQLARLAKHWTSTSDHKCLCSFSMAKVVQCSAYSCSESEQATWFLINTGFLEALTQQHQQLSSSQHKVSGLPNSSFLKIAKDTLFIDLTLSKMATLERMVLSQWWLLDTCMCDLCLVLAIRVIDIWTGLLNHCPFNWQDRKDIELWFFQHGKICSVLGSFLLGTGTGNVIPGNEWIPASRQKTASATKESSWRKVCGVCQTYQLLTLRRTHCALIWPFARTETLERLVLSQWWLLDTCMCDLCLVLAIRVIDIWTGLLNHCPINWRSSSQHKVWGVCLSPAFSAFDIARQTLFIDLALGNNENWEENGSLRVVTACACLQYWCSIWTGLLHERPINWQGWQNIELAQVITSACFLSAWQKLCNALLILARNRNKQRDSW